MTPAEKKTLPNRANSANDLMSLDLNSLNFNTVFAMFAIVLTYFVISENNDIVICL